jgi:speckle-type POZ protein
MYEMLCCFLLLKITRLGPKKKMVGPTAESSSPSPKQNRGVEQAITRVHYKWDIANFSLFGEVTGGHMLSPEFAAHDDDKLRWRLKLFPRGLNMECENYISVFLEMVSNEANNFNATFQFSLLNRWGEKVCKSVRLIFPHPSSISKSNGLRDFIDRKILSDEKKGLLTDDILTVLCDIDIVSETTHVKVTKIGIPSKQQVRTYEKLFQSMQFTDVTFSLEDGELKAHKAVLAASSLVFESMFTLGGERCNNFLVSDVTRQVFYEMLRFIYTGKIHKCNEMMEELLKVAHRYQLSELEELCRQPQKAIDDLNANVNDTSSSSTEGLARGTNNLMFGINEQKGQPHNSVSVSNETDHLDDSSPKRPRGRPRKSFPGDTPIVDSMSKRKRGRPPKSNRLSAPILSVPADGIDGVDPIPKRKRGRPPKNLSAKSNIVPSAEVATISDDDSISAPKRKLGRPKRNLSGEPGEVFFYQESKIICLLLHYLQPLIQQPKKMMIYPPLNSAGHRSSFVLFHGSAVTGQFF